MAAETFGDAFPGLRAMAGLALGKEGVPIEIEFGLDLILDGLERCLTERSGRERA